MGTNSQGNTVYTTPKNGQTMTSTSNGKIIKGQTPKKSISLLDILLGRK